MGAVWQHSLTCHHERGGPSSSRPMQPHRALLVAFCCCLPPAALSQTSRPHVHIVATGGTIASTNYYGESPGKIGVDQLLRAVPALDSIASISAQQFANVGSSAITPAMWLSL